MTSHLPFRLAVVSNLLALNRDWKIRQLCDLEPREMRVLLNIGSYMPIKAADIAYQSRLDSYTVSRAVKKLQSQKLITIERDETSRNIKYLLLNEAGVAIYQQLIEAMDTRSQEITQVLNDEEKTQLYNILSKLEEKTETFLAEQALTMMKSHDDTPADQKELIRWFKKGQS